MKHLSFAVAPLTVALALACSPLSAQTAQGTEEGLDLVEEGARLILRGLLDEIVPTINELEQMAEEIGPSMRLLADEMGPALARVMSQIDNIRNYEPPEILPNGDIIIRRRADAPEFEPPMVDL